MGFGAHHFFRSSEASPFEGCNIAAARCRSEVDST
jgi:hypothetical protein